MALKAKEKHILRENEKSKSVKEKWNLKENIWIFGKVIVCLIILKEKV